MATNYYDGIGVLVLARVTPVIKAMFGVFALDEGYPGRGMASIAQMSETDEPRWSGVLFGLEDLARQLGIPVPDSEWQSLTTLLQLMAPLFGANEKPEFENLLKNHEFEDVLDLESLFLLATCFDDGHGLTAIKFEGSWRCDEPLQSEFGGASYYLSREVRLIGLSGQALLFGSQLRDALKFSDVKRASDLIAQETTNLLAGIRNEEFRMSVRHRVAERLSQAPTIGDI
ncbi:hypothetical protein [Achromobacter anxifer]|uniref:hypothetical protein n=1 Tax=Achromobacter anxifer TaxID=1287737 RepID=UPI0023F9F143|nr:hypothetical protein [Achromobacter anxifer]MDF8361347.1 hypothetical protein [Achromobacter anxifer]